MPHQDTTMFLIICSAMVLFMTPGLAFFYGGLVRASSVISMMMMSFGSLGLISILWVAYGYAMSFGHAEAGNFVGLDGVFGIDLKNLFLGGVLESAKAGDGFGLTFAGFQGTFAIVTVALRAKESMSMEDAISRSRPTDTKRYVPEARRLSR